MGACDGTRVGALLPEVKPGNHWGATRKQHDYTNVLPDRPFRIRFSLTM